MELGEFETATGFKVGLAVWSMFGALLGAGYAKDITPRLAAMVLLSGLACGSLAPEGVQIVATKFFGFDHFPGVVSNGLAFIFGIGGMSIVPGVAKLWQDFRDDPVQLLRWFRGYLPGPKSDSDKGGSK